MFARIRSNRLFSRIGWVGFVVYGVGLLACAGCKSSPRQRFAKAVRAWPVGRVALSVAGGAWLEVETVNPSPGTWAVLHLWDPATSSELAHGVAQPWLLRGARIRYRNPHAQARSYELLVHARDAAQRGTVDLSRDGRMLARHVPVGGVRLRLATGSGIEYRVTATPGGPRAASLWLLDADWRLLGFDEHSGSTGLPHLASRSGAASLLLAASGAAAGSYHVYANDADDRDGDGVGQRLERALGMCDAPDDPGCADSALAAYYQSVTTGTRDTDRDGLSDADELFGLSAPLLDLPRFGADPRHKDVLVEVDHSATLDSIGFSESDLERIAALFEHGSARDLRNPDHLPGVHLHFDAGFSPSDPRHNSLFGDFGGSGMAREADYRAARNNDFSPLRSGYFRYALSTRTGRGQAVRDALTVNRDLQRVTIFAHELGHTLGLAHHGHDAWGKVNCKPNYYSIMNYLYQNRYEVGFSSRASRALNPASVIERGALGSREPAAALREPPLELDVLGQDVDWNRDGIISDEPVRAGLLWATYKSCGAAEHGLVTLAARDVGAATPVLVQSREFLLAFWLDASGRLYFRKRRVHADPAADCTQPAAEGCDWSEAVAIASFGTLRHIAGSMLDADRLAFAYVRRDATLHVAVLRPRASELSIESDTELAAARTEHAPSLATIAVDEHYYGARALFMLLFRAASPDAALWQASALTPAGPFTLRRVLDTSLRPVSSALGPSVATLATGESCGVFPDTQAFMRFYCYVPNMDAWADLTQRAFEVGLGPKTSGSAGMAFHRYRDANGDLVGGDATRGALYLSFTEPESSVANYPDNPHLYVSEWLSARHGAAEQIALRWRGRVITEWTNLAPGTSVALAESAAAVSLQGLMAVRIEAAHVTRLDYLPFVDGGFDEVLGSGNDFAVMERGICTALRGDVLCGGPNTGAY